MIEERSELCSNYGGFCKKEWVGLTDEERDYFTYIDAKDKARFRKYFDYIEAKLKEKNEY
jgi:hypothetical protein